MIKKEPERMHLSGRVLFIMEIKKMEYRQILRSMLTGTVAAAALASAPAHALVINFLNGTDLYAKLTTSGNTDFQLDFVGENISPGAFINELFMDGPAGTFTDYSTDTTAAGTYALNNYNGGGGAGNIYDWSIDFPQPNNNDRLTIGESALWSITTTSADSWSINKIHINAFDAGGNSIKINGCVDGTSGCGSITVPEPGTLALLGLGLAGLGVSRRRKAK